MMLVTNLDPRTIVSYLWMDGDFFADHVLRQKGKKTWGRGWLVTLMRFNLAGDARLAVTCLVGNSNGRKPATNLRAINFVPSATRKHTKNIS